jgi:recombination protein RecA
MLLSLDELRANLKAPGARSDLGPRWELPELCGRLVELCGEGASAVFALAFTLVLDAQNRGEPAAWVTDINRGFYPPDAAACGVDLEALAVVRLADSEAVPRAADPLLRSGAFGLLVLDLPRAQISAPLQSRLLGLAHQHQSAVVFLTEKPQSAPSLGSLISLRAEVSRKVAPHGFSCELRASKDKHRNPGWIHLEAFRGPDGLR